MFKFPMTGAYGLPRPWYFPVQPSYWFGPDCFKGSILSKGFWKPRRYTHLSVMEDDQALAMSNSDDGTLRYRYGTSYCYATSLKL